MNEWTLLGDFTEAELKKPLHERLAASSGRSLLVHGDTDETVWALETLPGDSPGVVFYVLRDVASVRETAGDGYPPFARTCRTRPIRESAHPDDEIRKHVNERRKAIALREFFELGPERWEWFELPPDWARDFGVK